MRIRHLLFSLLLLLTILCQISVYAQYGTAPNDHEIVISESDTLIDLSKVWISYIDEPPFSDAGKILSYPFQKMEVDELEDIWTHSINRRFWFKLRITNGGATPLLNHKLFCGYVDRMILYEITDGLPKLISRKGFDINKRENQYEVLYNDFRITLAQRKSRVFLIQLSSAFTAATGETITPYIVKRGYENNLNSRSKIAKEVGLGFLGVLSVIGAFMLFAFIMSFLNKDKVVFLFGLLCLSFILYFLRDLELMIQEVDIYPSIPDFNTISEPLSRSIVTGAFLLFTFNYFKSFYYRDLLKITSIATFSMGFMGGLWFLLGDSISFKTAYTAFDGIVYFGYIIIEQINSFVILGVLWSSTINYSRFYIIGTLIFILSNYGGLLVGSVFPGFSQIQHIDIYSSLIGTLIFTMLMAFMLIQRAITIESELSVRNTQVSQLNALNQIKSEFYTNITHEFRTPLTVILGMAGNLSDQLKEKSLISSNGKRLLELVNQMLDLSKAQSGKLELENTQSDIVAFIKHIVNSYMAFAKQQQISLSYYATHDKIVMDFDPIRFEQIITNLISNAIKHTPQNGEIKIEVTKSNMNLQCMVTDTGRGIAEQDIPYIFDRFYQSHESNLSMNKEAGTGIGLSIVKQLVLAMNGSVDVESKIYKGSIFTITIPITNTSPIKAPHLYKGPQFSTDIEVVPSPALSIFPVRGKFNILIVEDNLDVQSYISSCLNDQYNIITASDGQEGLQMAQEYSPDLIISDVMMPTMDGYQMTKAIRSDDQCNHIPIILLTAKASKREVIEGLSEGADDYLTKPFDRQELLLRVNNILESRRRYAIKNQLLIQSSTESSELHPWLQKFRDLIIEHISEDLSGDWLSKHLFLSRSQIHRKLQSLANLTTTEYIKQIRLQEGKKMIVTTELSIEEIAIKVGFKSASHFSTSFKAVFDQSPSAFRRSD